MPADLLTTADAARILGVSPRRVRALVKQRNRRLTQAAKARGEWAVWIGRQVGGGGIWVFTPEEVELLRPGPAGWPKRKARKEEERLSGCPDGRKCCR